MKTGCFFFAPFFLLITMSSCSFDYTDDADRAGVMPEIVLTDVNAKRYENSRESTAVKASSLEIYDGVSAWAAKDISFTQYAEDGTNQAEGNAGILLVDNKDETYSLGNTVAFRYIPDDMLIEAADLRWEKKTHSLLGPLDGEVHVKKRDGMEIRGNGFVADTLSWSFSLGDSVTGDLRAKDSDGDGTK